MFTHTCMCVCKCLFVYGCICMWVWMCMCVCIHLCVTCVYMFVWMCVRMCICVYYVCICIVLCVWCMYVYMRVFVCTCVYPFHVCVHVCASVCMSVSMVISSRRSETTNLGRRWRSCFPLESDCERGTAAFREVNAWCYHLGVESSSKQSPLWWPLFPGPALPGPQPTDNSPQIHSLSRPYSH